MLKDLPAGSKIVRLTMSTEPKLLKLHRITGVPCPVASLSKRTVMTALLGSSYSAAVNKQRRVEEKEMDFEPSLLWKGEGQRVEGSSFLIQRRTNPDKLYLAFRPMHTIETVYLDPNGKVVNPDDYAGYLPLPSKGNEAQDLEKEIVWRTVLLTNVVSVWYAEKEWIN